MASLLPHRAFEDVLEGRILARRVLHLHVFQVDSLLPGKKKIHVSGRCQIADTRRREVGTLYV